MPIELPKDITLDGELFGGRGQFQSTVSIVKTLNSPHWKGITFQVCDSFILTIHAVFIVFQIFDVPSKGDMPFEDRMDFLKKTFGPGGSHESDKVVIVEQVMATSRQHVLDMLKNIETLGGEGLMLRKARSYVIRLESFISLLIILHRSVCTRDGVPTHFGR
jgi:DNA ligase-1